jgi:hypothetical protein
MLTEKVPKGSKNLFCKKCDYNTCRTSQYERHLLTAKHKRLTIVNKKGSESSEIIEENFACNICNFQYKSRVGLWKHKKSCILENKIITNTDLLNNTNENEIVNFLMKENSDFKQLLIEQNKQLIELSNKISNNVFNNVNCNNNSHNKTFNLNMFLNETCKNAMNISDFADSIKLELSDLESVGELGYINGISNIIIKNLKELDITQRPIHCTDAKRETLYIKNKDKWEKEGEQKEIIVKFVNNIANKNIRMLNEFKKKYPDCCKYESKYSDFYSKLIIEAMGGSGGTHAEKHEKIIKKICKEVTVDKSML